MPDDKAPDRFKCPGCGLETTARTGDYCENCKAFVCKTCQRDGRCPVCGDDTRSWKSDKA